MITKEIKKAVDEILAARIDSANYGMMATKRASFYSHQLLARNGIKITSKMSVKDFITKDGENIGKVSYRYANTKRNGMYKMLKPKVEWF